MEVFLWAIILVSLCYITKLDAVLPHGENVEDENGSSEQQSGQLPYTTITSTSKYLNRIYFK